MEGITIVVVANPRKIWSSSLFLGDMHSWILVTASGSDFMPSADTTRPRYLVFVRMKSHFSARMLKPASLRHSNTSLILYVIFDSFRRNHNVVDVGHDDTLMSLLSLLQGSCNGSLMHCIAQRVCAAIRTSLTRRQMLSFFCHISSAVFARKPLLSRCS